MSSGIKSSKSSSTGAIVVALGRSSLGVMNDANHVVYEGWLLKKKRKKMQGYARRYFYLRANGTLSYSMQPGEPIRDQILLHNAALSSSPSNRYIHVDTERSTFHMRGMTQVAYENWMTALRRFIMMSRALTDADGTLRRSFNYNARTLSFSVGHAAKMNAVLSEMSETIEALDHAAHTMHEEELRKAASLKEKRNHGKDSSARDGGLFGIFHRHSKPSSVVLTPPDSGQELHEKQEISHETLVGVTENPPTLDTILSELTVVRGQHKQLTACFQALLHLDGANRPLSPLSATAEEEADGGCLALGRHLDLGPLPAVHAPTGGDPESVHLEGHRAAQPEGGSGHGPGPHGGLALGLVVVHRGVGHVPVGQIGVADLVGRVGDGRAGVGAGNEPPEDVALGGGSARRELLLVAVPRTQEIPLQQDLEVLTHVEARCPRRHRVTLRSTWAMSGP